MLPIPFESSVAVVGLVLSTGGLTFLTILFAACAMRSLKLLKPCMITWKSIWAHSYSKNIVRSSSAIMQQWAASAGTPNGPALKRRQVGGDKDELVLKAVQLLMKSNLKLSADVRALQSATFRTCLIPSTASFVIKAKEASQKYNDLVQAAGKHHDLGPPHVHVWAALTVEAAAHLTGEPLQRVEAHAAEIDSPSKLLSDVLYCRVAPAYGGKHVKIYLTTTDKLKSVADAFFLAFKTQGGEEKFGLAPKGGLERELQALLDEIQSK